MYPQSMFLSRNKKNNVYPCKPQFYCIKVGFKGVNIMQAYFRDVGFLAFLKRETTFKTNCLLFCTPSPFWNRVYSNEEEFNGRKINCSFQSRTFFRRDTKNLKELPSP